MTRPRNAETKIDRNSYGTPPAIIEMARELMGSIDCDPASNAKAQEIVKARRWAGFDHPDEQCRDGLRVDWHDNVWLNPPYGKGCVLPFVDRLICMLNARETRQACVLVNNVTETAAGQLLLEYASAVWFPSYRIAFLHPETGEPVRGNGYSQMLCYFAPPVRAIARANLIRTLTKHNLPGVVR